MTSSLNNILVVVGVLIVLFFAAFYLFGKSELSDPLSNNLARQELLTKTQIFISRSAKLQQITIDSGFFAEPAFVNLRSFSTAVPDQPLGKNNIFTEPQSIPASVVNSSGG